MIPCFSSKSLKLLVATADERYVFSKEYFRETHYPQIMHRYYDNQLIEEVTERELLDELLTEEAVGNRVYIIFGSTGSGKSELLRWIKDQWNQKINHRPVIRISRSELNPQRLINKCFQILGIELDTQIDENKWGLLLEKPITIMNQIVWSSISELYRKDEEIVPITLLLRGIIEKNVIEFTKQIRKGKVKKPLEIISQKQFEELKKSTTIPINIEYYTLRQKLVQKLDQFLFQGQEITSLMKKISSIMKEKEVRPLLIIDDLVQSINLYASDLLDHFISLEEGNWDVVIGLTPGSLQDSEKGSELVRRIRTLDTIEDRVKKLWLSDETGKEFFTISRDSVEDYMKKYVTKLKEAEGYICSNKCANYSKCVQLVNNQCGEIELLPFNSNLIKRIYDGIPIGKGKLRYLILHAKEISKFLLNGSKNHLNRVQQYVKRELYAEHHDVFIKTIAEWYAGENNTSVNISGKLLNFFGYEDETIQIMVRPIVTTTVKQPSYPVNAISEIDSYRNNIRDWVEGKQVNLELMDPVRLGVASFIQEIVKSTYLFRPFTSRNSGVLSRKGVDKRVKYPISFQQVKNNPDVIHIDRNLSAIDIANWQQLKTKEKESKFQYLSENMSTAHWVYGGEWLRDKWLQEVENHLGEPLYLFSFKFRKWANDWLSVSELNWTQPITSPFNIERVHLINQLFLDWYLLRENMIDGLLLQDKNSSPSFESWFLRFKVPKFFEQYQIGDQSLYIFFKNLQSDFKNYIVNLSNTYRELIAEKNKLSPFVESLSSTVKDKFYSVVKEKGNMKFSIETAVQLENLLLSLKEKKITEDYTLCLEVRKRIENQYYKCTQLKKAVVTLWSEVDSQPIEISLPKLTLNWNLASLSLEEKSWIEIENSLEKISRFFHSIPLHIIKDILATDINHPSVKIVKSLWEKIRNGCKKNLSLRNINQTVAPFFQQLNTVDFHQIKREVEKEKQRKVLINKYINVIKTDRGWILDVENNQQFLDLLKDDQHLNTWMKGQIRNLILHGSSTLPPIRWKKTVDSLEKHFPSFSSFIRVKLTLTDKSE